MYLYSVKPKKICSWINERFSYFRYEWSPRGCLIALDKIDQLDLLRKLFQKIVTSLIDLLWMTQPIPRAGYGQGQSLVLYINEESISRR